MRTNLVVNLAGWVLRRVALSPDFVQSIHFMWVKSGLDVQSIDSKGWVLIRGEGMFWGVNGAPGRSRTSDLLVRSQLLYPAELRAHIARGCNYTRITEIRA